MSITLCKSCNSTHLFTDKRGPNTGLYCADCGTWQKWLNKNEIRAFENNEKVKDTKPVSINMDNSYYLSALTKQELTNINYLLGCTNSLEDLNNLKQQVINVLITK